MDFDQVAQANEWPDFGCTNELKLCPEWRKMVSKFGQKGELCV